MRGGVGQHGVDSLVDCTKSLFEGAASAFHGAAATAGVGSDHRNRVRLAHFRMAEAEPQPRLRAERHRATRLRIEIDHRADILNKAGFGPD